MPEWKNPPVDVTDFERGSLCEEYNSKKVEALDVGDYVRTENSEAHISKAYLIILAVLDLRGEFFLM
ncbi:hypothetical protein ACQKMN_09355 [Ureibacillus composti]